MCISGVFVLSASLCSRPLVSEDAGQWRNDRQRAEDQVQPALEQNSLRRPLQAPSNRYAKEDCCSHLLLVLGFFKFFIYLLGPLHTERAAKEQQEIPNLLDTNLSCKFMRCKKPSLSPSNPLPTQRALTSAASWTRQCRPTRWWGTATTPTVTWSPCCVNQRTSSTPPSPLPTRPRHYRAARSVWHLYIFVCELKYWECAFFFNVCVP